MNTKQYNYSYANRIGTALTEPFYKLYKADTKYLETLDSKMRNIAEHIFDASSMLLLNMIAIPLSLPLWFIGKAIVQYSSPKCNYSSLPTDATNNIKADLLAMVKDHKEETIKEVFSHGAWYSSYDYRMTPHREFGAIPGLESVRNTDSTIEKIHSFLEQKMIFTKLSNSNRLIETIQKKLHARASDEISESVARDSSEIVDPSIKNPEEERFSLNEFNKGYIFNIRSLRSQNPDAFSEDLMDLMQKAKNQEMFNNNIQEPVVKDYSAPVQLSENQKKYSHYDYRNYLVDLVSKNHNLPLQEAVDFVAKNFYSDNKITYQGINGLLREIGVLS